MVVIYLYQIEPYLIGSSNHLGDECSKLCLSENNHQIRKDSISNN